MTEDPKLPAHLARVRAYLERTHLPIIETQIQELPGDASDRRYVRVVPPGKTPFLLLVHTNAFDRLTLPFINVATLLSEMLVPVPQILGVDGDLGILVLEDLGDVTLQRHLQRSELDFDERLSLYSEAASLIAVMQLRGRELESNRYTPFSLAFDVEKLMAELSFFVRHFLVAHRRAVLSSSDRTLLADEFNALAEALATEPRVFCHRDFHSRNLMVHDGRLHVIDFQDARMGPDTYDLASLLRDSYVDIDRTILDRAVAIYFDRIGRIEPADFRGRFDQMAVQRHLKALGTFGYQASMVGTDRYADAVPRTLAYLKSIFVRDQRFGRLGDLLATHVPELR